MMSKTITSKAVRWALFAGVSAAVATPVMAADDGSDLERIEVTGSRIKRTDMEGALPVTVIDRAQLEMSGEVSVAEVLRNTTFNSFGSARPQSGSSAQSFAGISLRGLGEDRTLILIDGRRAPVTPNVGSASDLNSIPMAAVERIEILSDGASAVYGSDAIGGVVNIITRKDFNGVEVKLGKQLPKREGGDTENGSITFGTASEKGSLIGGVSYNNREIVYQRDRYWSRGGSSSYGNNYYDVIVDPDTGEKSEGSLIGGVPSGCTQDGFFETTNTSGTTLCNYDYTSSAADEAAVENQNLFLKGRYEINDDWSTYLSTSISRVKSYGVYAAVPESVFVSKDSQYNTTGQDVFLRHRFTSLGDRLTSTDANVYDATFGFEGVIGDVQLDFGGRHTESKYTELGRNYLVIPVAEEYIANGTYNYVDPLSNDADVLGAMKATTSRDAKFVSNEAYLNTSFDLFDLDAGTVSAAAGLEYRDISYADTYDSLSESGAIGGSSGNSAAGGRTVSAAYAEVLVPLADSLEMDIAGRYERYSDYGSDFAPKVAFRWQPLSDLTLRASYGEGFRAPSLDILTAKTSFSADSVADEATCTAYGDEPNCSVQINAYRVANPNLSSEQSKQFSVGAAWVVTDWLNMTVDYYNIKIEDQIKFFDAQTLVNYERQGTSAPAGLGVTRNDDGSIKEIITGYGNQGEVKTDGLDVNFRTNFELGSAGTLKNQLQIGWVHEYVLKDLNESRDYVGDTGQPEFRATLQNVWEVDDFSFAWNINYIDGMYTDSAQTPEYGKDPSYTTHDVQFNWFAPWDGKISVGVNNVGDKDPVLNSVNYAQGYNFGLYDGYGRTVYLNYTQSF